MQNTINIDITTKLFFSASFQFQIYNIDNNNIDYTRLFNNIDYTRLFNNMDYTRLFNNIDYTRLAHNEYSGIVWYQFVFWNSLVLVSVLEQSRTQCILKQSGILVSILRQSGTQCILKQSGTSKYSETVWHNEYSGTV